MTAARSRYRQWLWDRGGEGISWWAIWQDIKTPWKSRLYKKPEFQFRNVWSSSEDELTKWWNFDAGSSWATAGAASGMGIRTFWELISDPKLTSFHLPLQIDCSSSSSSSSSSSASNSPLSSPSLSLTELTSWKDIRHPGGLFCLRPDLCPLCWQAHLDCPSVNEVISGARANSISNPGATSSTEDPEDCPPSYNELFASKRPLSAI